MGSNTRLNTNNYKDIVDEEFQHLSNLKFGVLVRGIRVVFYKVTSLSGQVKFDITPNP
jgi:hypothetical protein